MQILQTLIYKTDDFVWGLPMIVLLFGTHIFTTMKTGFIQRKIFTAIRLSFTKDTDTNGDITQFQALATSLASTIGTGNIIGVGTAIYLGGPGAVFWCWITGILGISTKYAETLISLKFRVKNKDGRILGGAMYALERGVGTKFFAVCFAIFTMLASFGIGCTTQVNAIYRVMRDNVKGLSISPLVIGIVCAILSAIVIIGGIKSVAGACEKLVPVTSILYIMGCLAILFINRKVLILSVQTIIKFAFTKGAIQGGFVGRGIIISARYGISRGLFSNESGMGSAPLVSCTAKTKNPVRQALVASSGTFWDTVVICLMSGLVIVSTVIKDGSVDISSFSDGGEMSAAAFSKIPFGPAILVGGIITFAFATVIGWSYYGERCAEYLFGEMGILPYRIAYVIIVMTGASVPLNTVWAVSDILNALMVIPNLFAVIVLSDIISSETKKYINNLDKKDDEKIPVL